jgi:DNA invertase Pin-like site-specific DNA recombinase
MIVGYARVSTDGQTLDAQQSALVAAGAEKVFAEKISGVVTDRKALGKALRARGAEDTLLVEVRSALQDQPAIFLTSWMRYLKPVLVLDRWRMPGRTRPRHMGS